MLSARKPNLQSPLINLHSPPLKSPLTGISLPSPKLYQMNLRETLRGTGVAIVTPFAHDLSVDFDALGKLIDNLIDNNIEYIVTLGTTGETPVLSAEEKKSDHSVYGRAYCSACTNGDRYWR